MIHGSCDTVYGQTRDMIKSIHRWSVHNIHLICIHLSASMVMRNASACTRLMHWVACSCPACVIVGRHIGSGAAQWLPREPSNIPGEIPEMAMKRKFLFTLLYFTLLIYNPLTLKVLVATIDALGHFETG